MGWVAVVDVSEHQGTINFVKMRAMGVHFIILRVTHGQTLDARVKTYYLTARTAGYEPWQIGFYSFINPKRGSAAQTALATANAILQMTGGRSDVLYMLDIESHRGQTPNVGTAVTGLTFSTYIKDHMVTFGNRMPGSYQMGYTNRSFWNGSDGPQDSVLAGKLEWMVPRFPLDSPAEYQAHGYPPAPPQWDEYAFKLQPLGPIPPLGGKWGGWQFSAEYNLQGSVYGCASSNLDLNIVKSDVAARWFPSPVVIPPTPPVEPITPSEVQVLVPHDGRRLLDTRPEQGGAGPLKAKSEQAIKVFNGVPEEATGVALNITFLGSMFPGYATLWSGADPRPGVSQLNWVATGVPESSFTVVKTFQGYFAIYVDADCHMLIDQVGYTMPPQAGAKGDKGDPGIQGKPGEPGAPGAPGEGVTDQEIIDAVVNELKD